MAKVSFVGFQEHVEIPENHRLVDIEDEISCVLDKDSVFEFLSVPAKISEWFYRVNSLDSKQSGKVSFVNRAGVTSEAVCTSYIGGKEISLLSQEFGEYSAKIIGRKDCSVKIRFRILTDNPDGAAKELEAHIENLRKLIA